MRWVLIVFASLLAGASVCLTVRFCAELDDGRLGWLPIAIGIGFEGSKYALGLVGSSLLAQRNWRGILPMAVSLTLAAGSVCASLGWMHQHDARAQAEVARAEADALVASEAYRDWRTRVDAIDTQMRALERARDVYLDAAQATRAVSLQPKLDQLRRDRGELAAQRPEIGGSQLQIGGSYWDAFGGDAARWWAYLTVAVLIELVSLVCLGLARADVFEERAQSERIVTRETIVEKTASDAAVDALECIPDAPQEQPDATSANVRPLHLNPIARLRSAVQSGAIEPSLRAVQKFLQCGQAKAREFLARLEAEGIITRDGSRYRLAQ